MTSATMVWDYRTRHGKGGEGKGREGKRSNWEADYLYIANADRPK